MKAAIYSPRALRDPARRLPRAQREPRDAAWRDGPPELPGSGWHASVKLLAVIVVLWGLYRAAPWLSAWVQTHW
ncbi:hypothetical protein [Cupriavidus sp. TMH.W2]|uniref:hypothetical protein n=1 Tax=Cupriavidus sp. TMH.W2 TaxID=3434465 RepID=UPI003D77E6CD